jgi:hypothetical protein
LFFGFRVFTFSSLQTFLSSFLLLLSFSPFFPSSDEKKKTAKQEEDESSLSKKRIKLARDRIDQDQKKSEEELSDIINEREKQESVRRNVQETLRKERITTLGQELGISAKTNMELDQTFGELAKIGKCSEEEEEEEVEEENERAMSLLLSLLCCFYLSLCSRVHSACLFLFLLLRLLTEVAQDLNTKMNQVFDQAK